MGDYVMGEGHEPVAEPSEEHRELAEWVEGLGHEPGVPADLVVDVATEDVDGRPLGVRSVRQPAVVSEAIARAYRKQGVWPRNDVTDSDER